MAEEARVVVARRVPRGREGQHALLDDGVAQVLVADLGAAQEAAGEGQLGDVGPAHVRVDVVRARQRDARHLERAIQRGFDASVPRARVPEISVRASRPFRGMIARPKVSRNERQTAESEVGTFARSSRSAGHAVLDGVEQLADVVAARR